VTRPTAEPRGLLPCPCGRPAQISARDSAGRRTIHCDDQECFWSITGFNDEAITERWNRRPTPTPSEPGGEVSDEEVEAVASCFYDNDGYIVDFKHAGHDELRLTVRAALLAFLKHRGQST
jgi:hypothetical protein